MPQPILEYFPPLGPLPAHLHFCDCFTFPRLPLSVLTHPFSSSSSPHPGWLFSSSASLLSLTTSQTNALSRPADHCVHLWPGEGALQAELHNPSPLHLQEGTVPPNTHPPSTTVKPSTCNWIVWGRRPLSARLSGPLPPGLGLGGSVDRYGMEQQRRAGLQALFMQLGPLPWVGGGRGSSGGSWGSDPTSSHLCAWPI